MYNNVIHLFVYDHRSINRPSEIKLQSLTCAFLCCAALSCCRRVCVCVCVCVCVPALKILHQQSRSLSWISYCCVPVYMCIYFSVSESRSFITSL